MKIQKLISFLKKKYGKEVASHFINRLNIFQVLVKTILSQRTREENTELASRQLFAKVNNCKDLLNLSDNKIKKLIKPAGFYNQKTKTLKKLCKILLTKYNGKVPNTLEELVKLPGVGDKTASVVLVYGFGKPTIPVDIHVETVSKRLGFVPKNAKPKQIREILEKLVPKKDQYIVNLGLVNFGREICQTRKPKCYICPLVKDCPYEPKNLRAPKKA